MLDLSRASWRKSSYSQGGGACVEVAFVDAGWRKSSFSQPGGNCVEVAFVDAGWRKSSYSQASGECVEVAFVDTVIAVRDSKNTAGPALAFPSSTWGTFVHAIKANTVGQP